MKKTKSVDKIKGFAKALKDGKSDSCCGGHSSAEKVKVPKKSAPKTPNQD